MRSRKLIDKNLKRAIITIIGILLFVIVNSWTVLQGEIIRKTPTHTVEGVMTPEGEVARKLFIITTDVCISIPILIGCIYLWCPPKTKRTKTLFVVSMCLYLLTAIILWYWLIWLIK